jgi:hypothetical protein
LPACTPGGWGRDFDDPRQLKSKRRSAAGCRIPLLFKGAAVDVSVSLSLFFGRWPTGSSREFGAAYADFACAGLESPPRRATRQAP